jgi:hypothetical protein
MAKQQGRDVDRTVGLKDATDEQIYVVLYPYRPPGDIRLYMPGAILNLQDLSREDIREALTKKWIATSDGVPGNAPVRPKKSVADASGGKGEAIDGAT